MQLSLTIEIQTLVTLKLPKSKVLCTEIDEQTSISSISTEIFHKGTDYDESGGGLQVASVESGDVVFHVM